jgi:putative redox protein
MAETRTTSVSLEGTDRWKTTVQVGPHTFVTDTPEKVGGKDLGPDPEELLLAAWGSCTAMTVQMYAQRKEWPVERVDVKLDLVPKTEESPQRLVRTIALFGPLTEEQRERLKDIAEKCPVHKLLAHTPPLETTLAEVTA